MIGYFILEKKKIILVAECRDGLERQVCVKEALPPGGVQLSTGADG